MSDMASSIPLISVVMSCYNAERWLEESIESVLNQTWRDYEFIIIDDGSKDRTRHIITRFADNDHRIVPIFKPNTGLADSLNVGIDRARGAWIARLDADDLCEPKRLELQWRAASVNKALVFIGAGLVLIDENGTPSSVHDYPEYHQQLVSHLTTARKFPAHSSAFFRADAFRRVGGYRPKIRRSQDRDLWLRFSEIGQLASLPQPLVRIRKHPIQISHEEQGRRQLIDSHVAMVSYWLRQAGHNDPVEGDDLAFDIFRSWIVKRLEEFNLFDRETFRVSVKASVSGAATTLLWSMVRRFLSNPLLLGQLGMERLRGSPLPKRLASEWVNGHRDIL